MRYITFEQSTGKIVKWGDVSTLSDARIQAGEGEQVVILPPESQDVWIKDADYKVNPATLRFEPTRPNVPSFDTQLLEVPNV